MIFQSFQISSNDSIDILKFLFEITPFLTEGTVEEKGEINEIEFREKQNGEY